MKSEKDINVFPLEIQTFFLIVNIFFLIQTMEQNTLPFKYLFHGFREAVW